jgi:hypothetical protein
MPAGESNAVPPATDSVGRALRIADRSAVNVSLWECVTNAPTCRRCDAVREMRVGPSEPAVIRIVLFEACSGFTRVTARTLAQQPKAAFVTGLRRSQLPGHAAR